MDLIGSGSEASESLGQIDVTKRGLQEGGGGRKRGRERMVSGGGSLINRFHTYKKKGRASKKGEGRGTARFI